MGIPAPKAREHAQPESEIKTDRFRDGIIDMNDPVEPEPSRDEPPALEPDSYVPDHELPPPDMDFDMGD